MQRQWCPENSELLETAMGSTVSGRFSTLEEARRAMARIEREGVSRATMTARTWPAAAADAADQAILDLRVRDAAGTERAHRLLHAAGAHEVQETPSDTASPAMGRSGLDAAGGSFGMAIADAATAPMKGVSASGAQHPTTRFDPRDKPSGEPSEPSGERSDKPPEKS
jgi:hypothetical protein